MKVVGNFIGTIIAFAATAAGITIGVKVTENLWENGLGDKVTATSKKLFRK